MTSVAERVRKTINDYSEKNISRFTSESLLKDLMYSGESASKLKPTVQNALYQMVKAGEIYKLKAKKKTENSAKPLIQYTPFLKELEGENPDYKQPQKSPEEPTLDYRQIGKAIVTNLQSLNNTITNLRGMLEIKDGYIKDYQKKIEDLNKRITELNKKVQHPVKYQDNGKFKLSEIAKINKI